MHYWRPRPTSHTDLCARPAVGFHLRSVTVQSYSCVVLRIIEDILKHEDAGQVLCEKDKRVVKTEMAYVLRAVTRGRGSSTSRRAAPAAIAWIRSTRSYILPHTYLDEKCEHSCQYHTCPSSTACHRTLPLYIDVGGCSEELARAAHHKNEPNRCDSFSNRLFVGPLSRELTIFETHCLQCPVPELCAREGAHGLVFETLLGLRLHPALDHVHKVFDTSWH
jgi:hypothetical protein